MGVQLDTGGKKKGVMPNINVTPLVDVVLVLLIIFMVVLPNVQEGKPIEMIKVAGKPDKNEDQKEPLTVTVSRDEVFTVDKDDNLPRNEVLSRLQAAYAVDPGQRILLRADAGVPYKTVRDLFADMQNIGFQGIALAVGVSAEWKEGEGG